MLFRKASLKYLYLLSSLGVVLIACSVVGLMLYFTSTRELLDINERQMAEKLESFAIYLEAQREVMEDISYDISGKIYYKSYFYKRNAYYEIELLKEFEKYKNNSLLVDDYFLLYRNNDWVFRSTANKYRFDSLMQAYGLMDERERLYDTFNATQEFSVVLCKDPGKMMLAFPVYTSGSNDESGAGTIVFVISAERLKERLEVLIGHIEGDLHLFWNGSHLMSFDSLGTVLHDDALAALTFDEPVIRQKDKSTYYVAQAENAPFTLVLHTPPDFTFESMERFSLVNIFYVVVAILLLLTMSILVGYNNYLPIKRLTTKYLDSSVKKAGKNELQNFESLFDSILQEKKEAEASMQEQYMIIKQQILNLVLDGNDWYIKLVSKPFMGIHLEGPLFYIMAIRLEVSAKGDMELNLSDQVEELSENGMRLYFVNTRYENYYAVIISAPDESLGNDAVDYAKTLLQEKYECQINVSPAFYNLQKIHDFFMIEIQSQRPAGEGKDQEENRYMNSFEFYEKEFERVLLATQAANYKSASYLLSLFAEKTQKYTNSLLFEQLIFHNAIYRLNMIAKKQGISIDTSHLESILQTSDRAGMIARLDSLIRYICEDVDRDKHSDEMMISADKSNKHADDLLSFIGDNYHEPGISLDLLSERYKLSTRYISNIIKEKTGLTYKEYLTNLRITKAQELLLSQNMTVTDVCESVGYIHLPHFIKTFKHITGFTPSNYSQRNMQPAERQSTRNQ
jgi:YesN/AraC family two-component response regulator